MLEEEHDELSDRPGFVAWTTFVHKHTGDMKESFLLIKDVDNQVIFCRYKALMIQYKVSIPLQLKT